MEYILGGKSTIWKPRCDIEAEHNDNNDTFSHQEVIEGKDRLFVKIVLNIKTPVLSYDKQCWG